MGIKTFYMNSGISSNIHQATSEDSPGADANTSPNYGWTPGTTPVDNYASADAQTMVAAAAFSATAQPDGSIVTTQAAGDCWRSPVPLHGTFAAGDWTFQGSVVRTGGGIGGKGKCCFRLFRSANSDGSGATEITSAIQEGSEVTPGVAQVDSTVTVTLSEFSVADEYLFVQVGWKTREVPSGMTPGTYGVILRAGSTASQFITTNFTQTAGQTEWKESGNCTNIADVNVDWISPEYAQKTNGDVAQFINTVLTFEQLSDYLNADTFGFTGSDLLDDDIITGIELRSDYNTDIATGISLNSWLLVINGSTIGTDQGDDSDFPTIMTIKAFGGAGNMLGAGSLTGADIKLTNSGFRIQAISHTGLGARGRVDQTFMKVHYTRIATPRSGVAISGGASMSF